MKRVLLRVVLLLILLCILLGAVMIPRCTDNPSETTGTEETQSTTGPITGWRENMGLRYYLYEDGSFARGWLELDGKKYYFNEDGILQTGWLELDGKTYYLREDGAMARGQVQIGEKNYFFTSAGAPILLVNPWNYVPEDYSPDLVKLSNKIAYEGAQVDRSCYEALVAMMADCNKNSGATVYILSAYRSHSTQTKNFNNKVNRLINEGYSPEQARIEAAKVVAVPGTSEHELGLAVDIIDTRIWDLVNEQANLPGQKWLMENCWRYGFVLRYPEDKTAITGIVYEPWHYRYVGTEVAAELHTSGLTLEEYIQSLN